MVASKGGISYQDALAMTRREATDMIFALAIVHDADIDWDKMTIKPPKIVQKAVSDHVDSAVGPGKMSFSL